jgi:hypothetical protein
MMKMGAWWQPGVLWSALKVGAIAVAVGVKKHTKTALFLAVCLIVFAGLWMWFHLGEDTIPKMRPWLETLNGATWSDKWEEKWCTDRFWFAGAVAMRTTINFAGPLSVLAVVVWFFFGGLERYMHMSQLELFRLLNAELVPTLVATLRRRQHKISEDDQKEMEKAADKLVESFIKDASEFSHDGE